MCEPGRCKHKHKRAFLFLALVLASSRFTRGLCLCLRRTCKTAFTDYKIKYLYLFVRDDWKCFYFRRKSTSSTRAAAWNTCKTNRRRTWRATSSCGWAKRKRKVCWPSPLLSTWTRVPGKDIEDDYTTNSHCLTYTFLFKRLNFWVKELKGNWTESYLTLCYTT